jgi:hypothetical protein
MARNDIAETKNKIIDGEIYEWIMTFYPRCDETSRHVDNSGGL